MSDNGGQQGQQQPAPQQGAPTSSSSGQMIPTSSQVQVQVQQQQQQQPSPVQQQQHNVNQQQQQQQQQQQIQLQQTTTTTAIHGAQQQHQTNHGNMSQLLIQQPIQQNSPYSIQNLQQLFNQGQLLMTPSNILSHNLSSQIQPAQLTSSTIQVIGKPFQQGQLGAPHMLTTANYAIPTSGANNQVNQSYIIGNIGNLQAPMFQHQQGAKQTDMQKVLSQQIGTQLPQGLTWTTPHFLNNGQNSYIIRGAQPDQMQFLQQQIQNNAAAHQQFMPLGSTTSQLPNTSIAPATTPVQHNIQQQGNLQHQNQQQQQIQNQPLPIQPQPTNVVSIKAPAVLQPKPPLQIQPTPQIQHQQQQQQQLQQIQVTMNQQQPQQIQMIPQTNTSQTGLLPQSISITPSQAHVIQQAQQQFQNQQQHQQPRHLTILPQGQQPHQMIIQQQPQQQQQPQAIRPNFSTNTNTVNVMTSQAQITQANSGQANVNGPTIPQQRAKIRKGVGRGTANGSPTQAPRPQFPRGTTLNPIPNIQQKQLGQQQQPLRFHEIGKPATSNNSNPQQLQQQHQMVQPLKTINLSALQPNLPDATLTPLIPQSTPQQHHPQSPAVQSIAQLVFTSSSTQLPSPNISITPSLAPQQQQQQQQQSSAKKEDQSDKSSDTKGELEKENSKANGAEDVEELTAKQKLPKAMVKPQVLTHVIEGFVIHEAAEPFHMPKNIDMDEPPKKKQAVMNGEIGTCEMCGKQDLKAKFKKNKRFCSSACAKGMKQQQQQQAQTTTSSGFQSNHNFDEKMRKGKGKKWGEGDGNTTDETNSSVGETSTLSPNAESMETDELKVNPMKWGVCEVVDFVKSLPGCAEYAEDFAVQEIDGQALMLLKEDHLMSAMGMKLGPALKLCARIDVIRSTGSNNSAGEGSSQK